MWRCSATSLPKCSARLSGAKVKGRSIKLRLLPG